VIRFVEFIVQVVRELADVSSVDSAADAFKAAGIDLRKSLMCDKVR
jgi:hypothetical protein